MSPTTMAKPFCGVEIVLDEACDRTAHESVLDTSKAHRQVSGIAGETENRKRISIGTLSIIN